MRARGRGVGVIGGAKLGQYEEPSSEPELYRSSEEDLEDPSEQSAGKEYRKDLVCNLIIKYFASVTKKNPRLSFFRIYKVSDPFKEYCKTTRMTD